MNKNQIIKDALISSAFVTCSEHEWKWKHEEQVNMARAVIILSDKIQKSIEEFNRDGPDSEILVKIFEILSGNESASKPLKVGKRNHVIPIGDGEIHNAQLDCFCRPLDKEGVVVHNAKDCREKYERIGIANRSDGWIIIGESFQLPRFKR